MYIFSVFIYGNNYFKNSYANVVNCSIEFSYN